MATPTPDQAPSADLDYEPSAFELAFAKHRSKFVLVGALAGVAALAYYGLRIWKEHSDKSSAAAFSQAVSLEDFRRVAKEQSGKNAGGSALLMAAQLLSQDGKSKEAMEELANFSKSYADHPLADLATLRLAEAQFQSGAVAEAKTSLAAVRSKPRKSGVDSTKKVAAIAELAKTAPAKMRGVVEQVGVQAKKVAEGVKTAIKASMTTASKVVTAAAELAAKSLSPAKMRELIKKSPCNKRPFGSMPSSAISARLGCC